MILFADTTQAWTFFKAGERDRAMEQAYMLYEQPQISDVIRAGCCTLLAYGEDRYLESAQEALELCKVRLALDPNSEISKQLLQEAEKILEQAEIDTALEAAEDVEEEAALTSRREGSGEN
jgi:uncharacterized protein YuzE